MRNLKDYFQTSLLLSGTPAEYQKNLEKEEDTFKAECPLYTAVKEKWVCKPKLSLIFNPTSFAGGSHTDRFLPAAIRSILEAEAFYTSKDVYKFPKHSLICCNNIDSIPNIITSLKKNGVDAHFISIHCPKPLLKDDKPIEGGDKFLMPKIDDRSSNKDEIMNVLDNLSTYFNDDKPVIVFQVDMLSEGVNVGSFNSIFIQSHSDKKVMQQIGRVLRNCKKEDENGKIHEKKEEGHASVYCMIDTENEIKDLLHRLETFGLSEDAFEWGRKLDLRIGGHSTEGSDEDPVEAADWDEFEGDLLWKDLTGDYEFFNYVEEYRFSKKRINMLLKDLAHSKKYIIENLKNLLPKGMKGKPGKNPSKGKSGKKSDKIKEREADEISTTKNSERGFNTVSKKEVQVSKEEITETVNQEEKEESVEVQISKGEVTKTVNQEEKEESVEVQSCFAVEDQRDLALKETTDILALFASRIKNIKDDPDAKLLLEAGLFWDNITYGEIDNKDIEELMNSFI